MFLPARWDRPLPLALAVLLATVAPARADAVVTFNEIHYHPAGDAEPLEFVELFNPLSISMDVSGWTIGGDVRFTFPPDTYIPGHGFLVIARSPSDLEATGAIAGPFSGQLGNGGGVLCLRNNSGRLMDEVAFDDEADWPVAPDGSGATLAKIDPYTASAAARNWHGGRLGGTPGRGNFDTSESAETRETTLVPKHAHWKYRDLGTDPGPDWMLDSYDDDGWPSGPAVLGYGDAWIGTSVSYGPNSSSKHPTTYFRHHFTVTDADSVSSTRFSAIMDDGAILYLNGTEFARVRLDGGTITYLDFTNDAISGAEENVYESLTLPANLLRAGDNLLAAEVHQQSGGSSDLGFSAELIAIEELPPPPSDVDLLDPPSLAIHELAAVTEAPWWIELRNDTASPLDPGGHTISVGGDAARTHVISAPPIEPGGFLVLDSDQLGFAPVDDEPVFLFHPDGESVADARVARRTPGARLGDRWLVPSSPTPGSANAFSLATEVVINEIMYHHPPSYPGGQFTESAEEWIELHNRGASPVDLGGWRLADAVSYEFPDGTILPAGGFLVVSGFSGTLSNAGERIVLLDDAGNPADEVPYLDGGRWPEWADGNGSSPELRDPDADNSKPEAWAASDEGAASGWKTYTYQATAAASEVGPDSQWKEFVLGLLDAGEVLIDDLSLIEDPDGANLPLIATGDFEGGAGGWRIIGNHRHSEVITDPADAGNHVLRLVATGATEHMHNHAEVTLANGQAVDNGTTYRLSFRAKWIAGSRLLNTRLYFNRNPKTFVLDAPTAIGTPGAPNSTRVDNAGPTFDGLRHDPAVPDVGQPVTVSVGIDDPDGLASATLHYSVAGGGWQQAAMTATDGRHSATLPGQAASTLVQFYVEAADAGGATATFPALGPDSRALYMVNDGEAAPLLNNFRILMTAADSGFLHTDINVMSNDPLGGTVISRERDIYYDVGIRLKGSERGRTSDAKSGYRVGFNADRLFNGVHDNVSVDKSSLPDLSRFPETFTHQAMNRSGGELTKYSDWIKLIAPRTARTCVAQLQLGHYADGFLDGQFEDGGDGDLFEFEYVYYPTTADANGNKFPQPDNYVSTTLRDHGPDKEDYRHTFLPKNNRARDDFGPLMGFVSVMDLTGSAFREQLPGVIDVDQWLRAWAYAIANGCQDNFSIDRMHNAYFYRRPSDDRFLYFPHDMDQFHTTPTLVSSNPYLQKIVAADAGWERLYYQHMRNILETSWNPSYMQRWTSECATLVPSAASQWSSHLSHITNCHNSLSSQLAGRTAPAYPFTVTGGDQTVPGDQATVTGRGWLDVYEVRLAGTDEPLELSWTASGSGSSRVFSWSATVPVDPGANTLTLLAHDYQGTRVGSQTVEITSTATGNPLHDHLRITEVMADPVGGSDYEFLELANTGTTALDLGSLRFGAGITFDFSAAGFTTLPAGGHCVLVADPAAFASRYDTSGITIAGRYTGKLANEGETLTLLGALNQEILSIGYGEGRGWPLAAEGAGHSLVPLDRAIDGERTGSLDYPGNWRASTWIGGSPGFAETPADPAIVLNEILANTDYHDPLDPAIDSNDLIEVHNPGDADITVGADWYLSDDPDLLDKWPVPAATVIPAGGQLAFDEVHDFHTSPMFGFGLNQDGERLFLSQLPPSGKRRVVDALRFKAQQPGVALGRYPDGDAAWFAVAPTFPGPNARPALRAVISELMYHPPDDPGNNTRDEFVEIHNPTASPVELWNADGPWRLRGGADFDFPAGIALAPGGCLLLVTFDPADAAQLGDFLDAYGLASGEHTILGPLSGTLDNASERLALEQPQAGGDIGDPLAWGIVDEVLYADRSPWPEGTDGTGRSLQRRFTRWSGRDPAAWYASFTPSPGSRSEHYGPDRVPDWWLAAHDPAWVDDFAAAAMADPDGDGLDTGDEYLAGTDPLNPASTLRLIAHPGSLAFETLEAGFDYNGSERLYSVRFSDGLTGFESLLELPGDGEPYAIELPLPGHPRAFFTLEASLTD